MNSSRIFSLRFLSAPLMALLAVVVLTTGCADPVTFHDNIEFELDFNLRLRPERDDDLHQPYVQGAEVSVSVHGGGGDDLRFESSDPSVLSVVSSSGKSANLLAVGPGEAELTALRGDNEVGSVTLSVGRPSRAELTPRGELLVDIDSMDVAVQTKVLLEERATFRVRYFDGETRLFGNAMLSAVPLDEGAVSVDLDTAGLFERLEFLKVRPHELGLHDIALSTAGVDLGVLTIDAVGPEAVARVEILGLPESNRDGRIVELYAVAYDEGDALILGDGFRWYLGEDPSFGTGDLFTYEHDRNAEPTRLAASVGEVEAEVFIRATEGSVGTTATVGCSAAGAPSGAATALGLLVVGALFARRRHAS